MFRRRADTCERSSGIGPCQGAPVPDRVHLAQSQGASPDRRLKQITLNRARTLRRAFSCTSECCIAHDARARQHSPAHSSPVEFFRIRTLISVSFVITLLRSSLNSFHLLPSVNIYFDVIIASVKMYKMTASVLCFCRSLCSIQRISLCCGMFLSPVAMDGAVSNLPFQFPHGRSIRAGAVQALCQQ